MATRPEMRLGKDTSEAIRVARVLCILSMVSVHFWPGAGQILAAPAAAPLHLFYLVVIDYLGRGSVPLLSVVSGVLLAISVSRAEQPLGLIPGKARVFLVPMILWSAILLALLGVHALLSGDMSVLPAGAMGWANALFALTGPPANVPLGFLRDVFLSAVVGIVGLALWRRAPAAGVGLILAAMAAEVLTGGILLLRPQILAFFGAGILLALAGRTGYRPSWPLIAVLLGVDAVLRHGFGFQVADRGPGLLLSYLGRLAMSLFMWRLALDIRAGESLLHRAARFLEPHIFIVFCSHMITVAFVGLAGRTLGIPVASPVYLPIFLAQFPLVTAVGLAISILGRRHAPALLALLSGKRVTRVARPAAPPVEAGAAVFPQSAGETGGRSL